MSVNYSVNPSTQYNGEKHLLYNENDVAVRNRKLKTQTNVLNFIYNPGKGKFLGRSLAEWCTVTLFLTIFYICLAIFCLLLMILFLEGTVNEDVPKMRGTDSLLDLTPGLSFRPLVDFKTRLIRYMTSDAQTYINYVQNLRAFTYTYETFNVIDNEGFTSCPLNGPRGTTRPESVCKFDLNWLDNCQKQNNFGFDRNKPCILVKINKVFGWLPDIIDTATPFPLLKCIGQYEADTENFGDLAYYPNVTLGNTTYGFFSTHFYPYLNQAAYRQPLVAVQFLAPKRNIVLMVQCTLHNVRNVDPVGIKFEILVD